MSVKGWSHCRGRTDVIKMCDEKAFCVHVSWSHYWSPDEMIGETSYSWTRLQDIFLCPDSHHVRLSHHIGINSCWVLVGETGNTTTLNTCHPAWVYRSSGSQDKRKCLKGDIRHVYIWVRAPCHPAGHGRTLWEKCHTEQEDIKTCQTSRPRWSVAVHQLLYSQSVIPGVNNQDPRWKFVSHNRMGKSN